MAFVWTSALLPLALRAEKIGGSADLVVATAESIEALPAIPDPIDYPFQYVLDDDSAEGSFGVGLANARQFLWLNRFTRDQTFGRIDEIWVLFPSDPGIVVGDEVQIVVYEDADGDPTNGAELLASFTRTVQAADGSTFSIYQIEPRLYFTAPGELLIGVIPRFIDSGVDPPLAPAALDTFASEERSWLVLWSGDPPPDPILPSDDAMVLIDVFVPGNFLIRAFGTPLEVTEIPTLGGFGLCLLAFLLAAGGCWMRRSSRRIRPS